MRNAYIGSFVYSSNIDDEPEAPPEWREHKKSTLPSAFKTSGASRDC